MMKPRPWSSLFLLLLVASSASADKRIGTWYGTKRIMVVEPDSAWTPMLGEVSPVIYANRCTGGCMVTGSDHSDAKNGLSPAIQAGTSILTEFQSASGQTGAAADPLWHDVVQCLKEVYSPFNITVTDVRPTSGQWTELMIAGVPQDVGLPNEVLGIAPVHSDCQAHDNAISFSFANHENVHDVNNICWTAAQESAHNFGLDHEYKFANGDSACNDPMTYRFDCGGQKFFRDEGAFCGEDQVRACSCPNQTQNSHAKLLSIFGPGTPITAPPDATILVPAAGATIASGAVVQVKSKAQRGVAHLDLYVNGHMWATAKGARFGQDGQPETTYSIPLPATVPDGVMDLVVKAYDDISVEGESAAVTVTKGAPCASAATCAEGQKCDAGKCYWDAPTGVLGDKCDYNEFCVSGMCQDTSDGGYCVTSCVPNSADACPASFSCQQTTDAAGVCLPNDTGGGGCCSVGHESGSTAFAKIALGMFVFGFVVLRRRGRR